MSERVWRLGIVATGVLATAVRLSSPSSHFVDGRLIPTDGDSAYHLRRAMSFFEHPPWPSTWDPFLGFPEGAPVPWSPGWDAWLALVAWLFGGFSTETFSFQVGMATAGLLVGVMTVFLAADLAKRLFGVWAGLAAGVFVALVPMHVAATQFARLDHNPAEGLFLLAMAAEATRKEPRWWVVGLLPAGACLAWVGGLMYAGLGMGAVCLAGLMSRETPWSSIKGMAFGVLILIPPAVAMGVAVGTPFTYAYLSGFHPAMMAVLTVGAAWLFALKAFPERRLTYGIGGVVGLVAVGAALAPFVLTGLNEWLLTEDPWLDTVQEMHPLFANGLFAFKSWERIVIILSWLAPALPFVLVGLGWRAWKGWDGGLMAVVAVTTGAFVLLLLQARFGWTLAPLLGVVLAGALVSIPRVPAWFAVAAMVLGNLHSVDVMQSAWVNPKTRQFQRPYRFEAYHWIRENTPAVDPHAPEYGIAGTWDHGHWLSGVALRPEHIGHFGTYAGGVQRYLDTQAMYDEEPGFTYAMMERDRLRYLVFEAQEMESVDGPMKALTVGGDLYIDRLRGVFAASMNPRLAQPGAWVYELVEGAVVKGRARPGAEIRVRIPLHIHGLTRPWRVATTASEDGIFEARVPYWTGDEGAVGTGDATLYVDEVVIGHFSITEADVREGLIVGVDVPLPPEEEE